MMETNLLISKLQRDLNCLSDPDRSTRRRALERLQKRLLAGDSDDAASSLNLLQAAWDEVIMCLVVRTFSDPVEKCRELAIDLMSSVGKVILQVEQTVIHVLPMIAERMGQVPVLEESEEIRLLMINLLATGLLPRCSAEVCVNSRDDIFKILMSSIADQFHEIKKGACQIIVLIGERAPKTLEDKTEALLKALLANMNHSHLRVRIAVLQAIDAVVRMGLSFGVVSEHLAPGVKPLVFDRSASLRALFFTFVARWLGWGESVLDNQSLVHQKKDPMINIPQLLPLLLLGITDESKDVAASSLSLVEEVGRVYEQRMLLSHSLAGKMMVDAVEEMTLDGASKDQDGTDDKDDSGGRRDLYREFVLPDPYKGRPSVGCRRMVQAFLGKLLGPSMKDLQGWILVVRLGAARLIHTLLILAEEHSINHLDVLIPAFTSTVGDDEVLVAQQIISAVQVLGYHTKADYWVPLILDIVTSPRSGDVQRANGLVVMAGLLYGTPQHMIQEKLVIQLSHGLSEPEIRCSEHSAIRRQLLAVLTNLLHVAGSRCESSSLDIFLILLQLQSAEGDVKLQQGASDLADALTKVVGLTSVKDLYLRHIDSLIPLVTAGHELWSGSSPVKSLFQTFMKNAGNAVGPYLEMIINMFCDCLHEDRDPALRISLLQLLDDMLENEELGPWWTPLVEQIILGMLIPCGVWRIGKVGAAIRHRSMVALGTLLRRDLCSQEQMLGLLQSEKGVLGVIFSCLDEDYYVDTRRVTCHVMQHLVRIAGSAMEDVQRTTVSHELQKRLEDSNDTVRLEILPAIGTFFLTMPTHYSDDLVKGFLNNLLIHMDDANPQIQAAVCIAGEACATQRPAAVIEVAKTFRSRHRITLYCDRLISFAASIDLVQDLEKTSRVP